MTLTRAAFFRSLFLAPGAAIAAADRPIAEKLAEAEELKLFPVYKFHSPSVLSAAAKENVTRVWKLAWKAKDLDPPILLILDGGSDVQPLSPPVTVNVRAVHPSPQAVAEAVTKALRESQSHEVINDLLSRGRISVNDARRFYGLPGAQ